MIIAIGGVSRSGKSTLAQNIRDNISLEAHIIAIDDYIVEKEKLPQIRNRIDWESPKTIAWETFGAAIQVARSAYRVVIVEGFLVFYDASICGLYDLSFLLQLDFVAFYHRRLHDDRWGHLEPMEEPTWYVEHVWDSYQRFGKPKETCPVEIVAPGDENELLEKTLPKILKSMHLD